MKRHAVVEALLDTAQNSRQCAFGATHAQRQALGRRATALELRRVFPNMYARNDYWEELAPPEQTMHIARTLHVKHPDWIFAGLTAAAIHGFEHQWRLHGGTVTVVASQRGSNADNPRINRIHIPHPATETIDGITVTDKARTVVDCGIALNFRDALPIVDSAFGKGVTIPDILSVCSSLRQNYSSLFRLLHYANAASENGGESLARGTIIEQSFMLPEIQSPFVDPQTGKVYRGDFVWRLADGRIVVGELDGTEKYMNPDMTGRKSIQGGVFAEREREEALERAGVTSIVRFSFDDVIARRPLVDKLVAAGIPRGQ